MVAFVKCNQKCCIYNISLNRCAAAVGGFFLLKENDYFCE